MAAGKKPTAQDAQEAVRKLLGALVRDSDIHELIRELNDLHPRHNTFPGEVFLRLGADALEVAAVTRAQPLSLEGVRERYLPECEFRGREHRKMQYALLATAALHGGVEPDLLDEVAWWQTDDFWHYGLFAAVACIRAAAAHSDIAVPALCERLAETHGVSP